MNQDWAEEEGWSRETGERGICEAGDSTPNANANLVMIGRALIPEDAVGSTVPHNAKMSTAYFVLHRQCHAWTNENKIKLNN